MQALEHPAPVEKDFLPLNGTAQIAATITESGGAAVQNGTTVTFNTTAVASLGSVARRFPTRQRQKPRRLGAV